MSDSAVLLLVVAGIAILWLWLRVTSLTTEAKKSREDQVRTSEEASRVRAEFNRLSAYTQEEARKIFEDWRGKEIDAVKQQQAEVATREAKIKLDEWRVISEAGIRADARQRSQSTIIGKVTEHIVPYFPTFVYNPKDARFIGSPVDFVVFDGLSTDDVSEIVFVEVKTGVGSLTTRERQVRDAVLDKRVSWKELRVDTSASEPLPSPPTLQADRPSVPHGRNVVPGTRVQEDPARTISPEFAVVGCSLCGARNRVPVESLGKVVRCGSCKREIKMSSASFS